MQRQRSILSFFQKPSPAKSQGLVSGDAKTGGDGGGSRFSAKEGDVIANGDASVRNVLKSVEDEVRGTDTPPEKVPRRVLPSSFKAVESAGGAPSLFSNIMHKFVKVDDRECSGERNGMEDSSVCIKADNVFPQFRPNNDQPREGDRAFSFSGIDNLRSVEDVGVDDDVLGPETPGTQVFHV